MDMNIPKVIHAGFQTRHDTYTGKLAYVIYTDEKGKVRKENSWKSWKSDDIPAEDHENIPTSGFVINRNGGGRGYSSWNSRNEFVRVHDPRGFEFEISIWNLLFILQECTSTKGKGLDGEFVYGWSGKDLVLIPTDCKEYTESVEFTALKSLKVTKKDMTEGHTYLTKNKETLIYLGRHNVRDYQKWCDEPTEVKNKFHVFYDVDKQKYAFEKGFTKLARILDANVSDEFTQLHADLLYSEFYSEYVGPTLIEADLNDPSFDASTAHLVIKTPTNHPTKFHIRVVLSKLKHSYHYVSDEAFNQHHLMIDESTFMDKGSVESYLSHYKTEKRRCDTWRWEVDHNDILTKFPNSKVYVLSHEYESGLTTRITRL